MKTGLLSNEIVRERQRTSSPLWRPEKPVIRESSEKQVIQVAVQGCSYLVDLGPEWRPQFHRVSKTKECSCRDAFCPAIDAVREYLRGGGLRAPEPLGDPICPICGAATYRDRSWDGRYTREPGWRCEKGGLGHFLMAKADRIRQGFHDNPWLFPPVPGYAGVRRSEILTADECRQISTKTFLETGYDPTQ